MSASSSGTGAGRNRQKNGEMAANMKKLGIRRTHGNCPICHGPMRIPLGSHRCKSRQKSFRN